MQCAKSKSLLTRPHSLSPFLFLPSSLCAGHDAIAPKCRDFEGECHNGACLELSRFCDGHWDCDNDELQCGKFAKCVCVASKSYNIPYRFLYLFQISRMPPALR